MERFAVIYRRKVKRRSSNGITEEEVARNRASKTEQAARGSHGDETAAVAAVAEVLPAVLCGVVYESRRIGVVRDHEEPRISERDLGASKVEAFGGLGRFPSLADGGHAEERGSW